VLAIIFHQEVSRKVQQFLSIFLPSGKILHHLYAHIVASPSVSKQQIKALTYDARTLEQQAAAAQLQSAAPFTTRSSRA
jgi:hypothetical protein